MYVDAESLSVMESQCSQSLSEHAHVVSLCWDTNLCFCCPCCICPAQQGAAACSDVKLAGFGVSCVTDRLCNTIHSLQKRFRRCSTLYAVGTKLGPSLARLAQIEHLPGWHVAALLLCAHFQVKGVTQTVRPTQIIYA